MDKLTVQDLDRQPVEMLPAREALSLFNLANIYATNSSTALNVLTVGSAAVSSANQGILVAQS
jgi:hypothetical protein